MRTKKIKTKTNAEGYQLVLQHFADAKTGLRGAKTRWAEAIGMTRQIVFVWESRGIPLKYRKSLCELTGLDKKFIWPEDFN